MTSEDLARRIVEKLRANSHEGFFVGGAVRDRLLGRLFQDVDVATDAVPDRLLQLFPGAEAIGAAFGVVLVKAEGAQVEVATYRRDHDYLDGRRPESVAFTGSAEEDVRRRDFTINGLLSDPESGRVIDYVGGRADLEAGLVRAIGDPAQRFQEDKLRMLRAVRFAARLDFEIEERTFEAIREQADSIRQIAAERIRDELNRILTEGGARRGFELLDETGLLIVILPEVARLRGVEQSPEHHPEGDVWTHTLLLLEGLPAGASVTLAMGALLHDIGKPDTFERGPDRIRFYGHVERGVAIAEAICRRLRYSRAETDQILALVGNHMRFMHVHAMRDSKLKRFLRQPKFEEHLELHRLDCAASHGKLDNWRFVRERQRQLSAESLRPEPLLDGRDLIAAGYQPGPSFQKMLEEAEDAQLEGGVTTKDEALALVRQRFGEPA